MDGRPKLCVLVADEHGHKLLQTGIPEWLARVAPPSVSGVIHLALVSDARMRALNRKFRGKDKVTDVLSFPVDDPREKVDESVRPFLGDIVIARGVAERQAASARHHIVTELRVLALHGFLHLLGYDHEHDNGQMRRLETRLRRKGGLTGGLIERARDSS